MTDTAIRFSLILGMIVSASLFVEIRLRARQSRKDGRRGPCARIPLLCYSLTHFNARKRLQSIRNVIPAKLL